MSRRAFTLVELLVVIGIIALLISILLPSLTKAREQAKRVSCASQQRQIFLAIRIYADESKGWLPGGTSSSPNGIVGGQRIVQLMGGKADFSIGAPYWMTDNVVRLNTCPSRLDPLDYDWPYYRDFGAYIFPYSGEQTGITTTYMYYGGFGGYGPTYPQWHGWYMGGSYQASYEDPEQPGPVPKLNNRRRSAEVGVLTDRMWPSTIPSPVYFGFMNYSAPNHMTGNRCIGGNVTCLDGHTEWRRIEDTKLRILDATGVCFY